MERQRIKEMNGMARQLPKVYDPKEVEDRIYKMWMDGGYFHTQRDPEKKPFTVVMPPPKARMLAS